VDSLIRKVVVNFSGHTSVFFGEAEVSDWPGPRARPGRFEPM
jgi:hypothetical protein